jgi:hypothetical protein
MNSTVYKMKVIDNKCEMLSANFLLLAGGSDYRAYEILRKIREGKIRVDHVLLFNFDERISDIPDDDSYFAYKKIYTGEYTSIVCSIKKPSSCLNDLEQSLQSITSATKIAIDISCFTKPFFFFLIKLLRDKYNITSLEAYYTEPDSYIFPKRLFNSFHSSSGPLTVNEIPGFTGIESRNAKRILVILLGFDGDLSQEINEDVSPSKTILINGFPGYAPKFKDISLVINEKLTSNKDFKLHYARANNPFEVYNLLDKIRKQNDKSFINIAPLGTKPMALGACLFAIHNPNVRIVYPAPEQYEKLTTNSCSHSWKYEIHLEK